MTQLELQAFLAVLRTGSFSQAAQALFITQPALSRRIQTLEEELGYRLLERRKGARTVDPTQEGRAFAPMAEHWLTLWEEARTLPQREENQVFRVASVGSVSTYILSPVLRRFLMDGTSRLTFHQYHSLESYSYVERGEIDLAFVSDDMFSRSVETIPAFREPMLLVTRPDALLPPQVHPSQLDAGREIRMEWRFPRCGSTRCPLWRRPSAGRTTGSSPPPAWLTPWPAGAERRCVPFRTVPPTGSFTTCWGPGGSGPRPAGCSPCFRRGWRSWTGWSLFSELPLHNFLLPR